jgi:hypothetical protein
MNSKNKRLGKRQLMRRCQQVGARLFPDRQTTKEGVRLFLVDYAGKLTGYQSLDAIERWLNSIHVKAKEIAK